jgi:hypothetical protein
MAHPLYIQYKNVSGQKKNVMLVTQCGSGNLLDETEEFYLL